MKKTIDFSNFSYYQLSCMSGLKEKVKKILNDRFDGARLAYYEVNHIDVEKEIIYIFVLQTNWQTRYFKLNAVNFSKRISEVLEEEIEYADLNAERVENFLDKLQQKEALEKENMSPEECELEEVDSDKDYSKMTRYDRAVCEVSKSLQALILGPDFEIQDVATSYFEVSLKSFIYQDIEKMVSPIVKIVVPSSQNFKILNRTDSTLDILIVTKEAFLYQFRISISDKFKGLFNRYINFLPYDQKTAVLKKACMDAKKNQNSVEIPDDQKGLLNVIRNMTFDGKPIGVDPIEFAKYAFLKTNSTASSGYKVDGCLKNVYEFFRATSKNDNDCRMKIVKHFRESSTFKQKEAIEEKEQSTVK